MIGVSGRWGSQVETKGSDHMGHWSWVDLRGKNNRMIKVISAYRVSHTSLERSIIAEQLQ